TEVAIGMVRQQQRRLVETQAAERVTERLLDLLLPQSNSWDPENAEENERRQRTRDKMKARLEAGELEDRAVELTVEQKTAPVQIFSSIGMEQMDVDFQSFMERMLPRQPQQQRQVPIKEARRILMDQESDALIDRQAVTEKAVELAENQGIIFLDEIHKISRPPSPHPPPPPPHAPP